ncbi:MAG TPA: hypothetical protein VFE46_00420 [Pirellulales bacterium]|jgi:hypothetical protein|nr:hypothetical protein [Pirellulales bacterium]
MSTAIQTVPITAEDTEYSIDLGTISNLTIGCREQLGNLRIALQSGYVAERSEPFLEVKYSSKQSLSFSPAMDIILYIASDTTNVVAEIVTK